MINYGAIGEFPLANMQEPPRKIMREKKVFMAKYPEVLNILTSAYRFFGRSLPLTILPNLFAAGFHSSRTLREGERKHILLEGW